MKAVVGLGNPGTKYEKTRHNVGFRVVDTIFDTYRADWTSSHTHKSIVDGEVIQLAFSRRVGGKEEDDLLIKPLTYMNRSGKALKLLLQEFGVSRSDLLVICDDVNLPLGRLRLRASGSSGGQNGLQSIIDELGSEAFARLRVGISPEEQVEDMSEFVLDEFAPDEYTRVKSMVRTAVDAVLLWFERGTEAVMNEFNRVP